MSPNPIEANPVTRFLLGIAVIFGMGFAAYAAATGLETIGVPYPAWIGTALGAVIAFAAFAAWYRRYDASAPRIGEES